MIKILLIVSVIVGYALALPINEQQQQQNNPEVYILRNERVDNEDGGYQFAYETSDGQKREESAYTVNLFKGNNWTEFLSVTGSYSYIGPDGVNYKVSYVADENGFRPEGDHIFKSPQEASTTGPIGPDGQPLIILGLPPNAIKSLIG